MSKRQNSQERIVWSARFAEWSNERFLLLLTVTQTLTLPSLWLSVRSQKCSWGAETGKVTAVWGKGLRFPLIFRSGTASAPFIRGMYSALSLFWSFVQLLPFSLAAFPMIPQLIPLLKEFLPLIRFYLLSLALTFSFFPLQWSPTPATAHRLMPPMWNPLTRSVYF